jgi:succinoglycan biosynthesis protein ExoO
MSAPDRTGRPPLVSVVMANHDGERHIARALRSVLAQTLEDIEVIVSDDASSDRSVAIVQESARTDARVRLLTAADNGGPGAARNRALDVARGEWVAIVDADDIIHPERLERLVAAARDLDTDLIADDLLHFADGDPHAARTLLGDAAAAGARHVTAEEFVASNTAGSGLPPLGYLKPLMRRARLDGLRYDETVRIGEDYDLLLRLILSGARLHVLPEPFYLYRRHPGSISHRLSEASLAAMIENHLTLVRTSSFLAPGLSGLFDRRLAALEAGLAFERLVASLKCRDVAGALSQMVRRPALVRPLAGAAREHFTRRRKDRSETIPPAFVTLSAEPGWEPPAAARPVGATHVSIRVPPYRSCGLTEFPTANATWIRLAAISSSHETNVAAHGLAGLHALGFMPEVAGACVHVDDPTEFARASDICRRSGREIVTHVEAKMRAAVGWNGGEA